MGHRQIFIKSPSAGVDQILLDWEVNKKQLENINVDVNQSRIGTFKNLEEFGKEQVFPLEGGRNLTIKRKRNRYTLYLDGKNLIILAWKKVILRGFAEMALISGVLLLILMVMDGLSWLISGHSLFLIWPKGRLSVFPVWLVCFGFGAVRIGLGMGLKQKPSWVWLILILINLFGELRFIRSVYELWFFSGMTFVLIPLLWLGLRASKVWHQFGY